MNPNHLIDIVYRYWADNLSTITEGYNGAYLERHFGYRNDGGPSYAYVKLSMWPKLNADAFPSLMWCPMFHGAVRVGSGSNLLIWDLEKEHKLDFETLSLPRNTALQERSRSLEETDNHEEQALQAAAQVVEWLREALTKEKDQ